MKSMQPRHNFLRETTEPPQSPNPSSGKPRIPRKHKASKENAPPPSDLNYTTFDSKPSPAAKMKSPLPPRPPTSNPLKRKLEMVPENSVHGSSDSGVQVIVRMRPPRKDKDEGEMMVQKTSSDALSINGQTFTFDSVADTDASQLDIFQLVGVPLVENCMAGFNSSVFAYGQTGSGKTYTMWGPANALLDENLSSDQQGLTPRVLERLFARINEEQIKHADKQLKYQCQCSFLEIYNEQITDLLDPNPKSLQIREDVKSGVYVENLTEECVRTIKDVTQLLMKGLSNRRTGSTSINAESSRSHTVFTCVVESRYKSVADGISSFKRSRINLVDLAGSERQKLTGAAGERLKEAGNINRSLSQLGNLINILAEISQTGKQRHIPYRDSRLTFLLQESLGGNAKLAMVCAVSPTQSCKSETFSTLRFAQRAKAIKNKAVVNEVMQDDVNHLREVIRQLRDELQRIKANGKIAVDTNGGHSAAWFRQSLNILRASLNRPMMSSHIDDDGDEEMEIDEEAVERLCAEVANQSVGCTGRNPSHVSNVDTSISHSEHVVDQIGSSDVTQTRTSGSGFVTEQGSDDTDVNMEEEVHDVPQKHASGSRCITEQGPDDMNVKMEEETTPQIFSADTPDSMIVDFVAETPDMTGSSNSNLLHEESASKTVPDHSLCEASKPAGVVTEYLSIADEPNKLQNGSENCVSPSLMIVPCDVTQILKSPTPSVSPRVNTSRKSLKTSSMMTASQKDLFDGSHSSPKVHVSVENPAKLCSSIDPSTQTSKNFSAPAEQLAASIRHGLEIIGGHRHSSALRRSAFRFSLKPSESRQILPVPKIDAGVQTVDEPEEDSANYICNNCKNIIELEGEGANELLNMELVPVDASELADKSRMQVPKAVEKVLAGAIRREMALEDVCAKKASEIMQLNRLVQQYKHERECNAIISQTREDKILRLESLMDGVLPTEEYMEEELVSLTHNYKLLKEKYDNHPELLRTKIELNRVQDELENLRNFNDMGEREVLLEEIQDLRSQLKFYVDSSSASSRTRNSMLNLTYSCEPKLAPLSTIKESTEESVEQKFEQERKQWTEVESMWISLSDELRSELEASRSLVEKTKQELETEKKCAEEVKEAMQRAMEGQSRMLEQYADLEEKHMELLIRHRKIWDGVEDVKKAAAKAGVKGAESKFINSLAAEITALRLERERERRYLRDENKGLQAQLQDTAEAVEAAGELLIRLKEADEAVAIVQRQATEAKQEANKAYIKIEKLKKKHENEMSNVNELLAQSRLPKEPIQPAYDEDSHIAKYDVGEPQSLSDQQWKEEFKPFYNGEDGGELQKLAEPSSWFSGYDRCNI
ncbi:kinesin-like protein KIN-12B [Argentina anserina]|uniref:kinesin-like protein KIN-12B n=1 Tax=Argentina anserina TaxID=57926 RepID=UPI0021763E32|nr:kinesin-like protein KIN-12B [Potentilla anserina]